MGMKQAEKSGLGIYSVKAGTFIMTAIVVVNALGDISDYETGKKLAGLKNSDRTEYVSCEEALYQSWHLAICSQATQLSVRL